MSSTISTRGLTRRFGDFVAVDRIRRRIGYGGLHGVDDPARLRRLLETYYLA